MEHTENAAVGCVIMASGRAVRFGSNKLLADFGGAPLIARALDVTETPALAARVVVTRSPEVAELACKAGVKTVLHSLPGRNDTVRLGLEALLSELPFDLAFYGGIEWGDQNVYFTLTLGLLALWAIQSRGMEGWLLALTAALAAELLGCDYGMYGVLLILLLDRFHRARSEQLAGAALLNLAFFGLQTQTLSLIALPLLWLYNGKRGRDDLFNSYEDRGDQFKKYVREL